MSTEVGVYYDRFLVGNIHVHEDGRIGFQYSDKWLATPRAFPISVRMPLSSTVFPSDTISPWLANLLPEEQQLDALSHALGLSQTDAVALLTAIGGDTAGGLSFGEPSPSDTGDYVPLTEFYRIEDPGQALDAHFEDLSHRPLMAGEDGIRLSLAGGQKKTTLAVLDQEGHPVLRLPEDGDILALPRHGAPSTIIIKPDNPRLPGIVENETYCLTLAHAIGLTTARVRALHTGTRGAICVLRYDRQVSQSGQIRRLHQEDFAQASGTPPGRKYEIGTLSGFTLADLFRIGELLEPKDALMLFDQFAFNLLVANTDAHAKNYSILHRLGPSIELSPLYDVSTVPPWPQVNQYFAQKICGRKRKPCNVTPEHLRQIAGSAGFRPTDVLNRVTSLVDLMIRHRPEAEAQVARMPGVASGYLQQASEAAETNALRVLGRLPRPTPDTDTG